MQQRNVDNNVETLSNFNNNRIAGITFVQNIQTYIQTAVLQQYRWRTEHGIAYANCSAFLCALTLCEHITIYTRTHLHAHTCIYGESFPHLPSGKVNVKFNNFFVFFFFLYKNRKNNKESKKQQKCLRLHRRRIPTNEKVRSFTYFPIFIAHFQVQQRCQPAYLAAAAAFADAYHCAVVKMQQQQFQLNFRCAKVKQIR